MQLSSISARVPFRAQVESQNPLISGNWVYLQGPSASHVENVAQEPKKSGSFWKKALYTLAAIGIIAGGLAWGRSKVDGIKTVMENGKKFGELEKFSDKVKYVIGKGGDYVIEGWNKTIGKLFKAKDAAETAAGKAEGKAKDTASKAAEKSSKDAAGTASSAAGKTDTKTPAEEALKLGEPKEVPVPEIEPEAARTASPSNPTAVPTPKKNARKANPQKETGANKKGSLKPEAKKENPKKTGNKKTNTQKPGANKSGNKHSVGNNNNKKTTPPPKKK